MDSALISGTRKEITAWQFENMSFSEQEAIRELLICPVCKVKASFVNNKDRKKCFRAKHSDSCDLKSKKNETVDLEILREEPIINIDTNNIKIREKNYFTNFWDDNEPVDDFDGEYKNYDAPGKVHTLRPETKRRSTLSLYMIHRMFKSGNINEQNYFVEVEGNNLHIRDAVVRIDACTDAENIPKFYCGQAMSASLNWLNASSDVVEGCSLLIKEISDDFWKTLRVNPKDWNEPIDFVVKGILSKAKESGKLFVKIDSFNDIYINRRQFKRMTSK